MAHSLLFVDDQTSLLYTMREYFRMRGFAVDCATELEEALALVDCREYALVISDVALKGVRDAEGLEVVSHLRGSSPQTKIIILTGLTDGPLLSIRERMQEWHVDSLLTKPQPLAELAALVERLLAVEPFHANAS